MQKTFRWVTGRLGVLPVMTVLNLGHSSQGPQCATRSVRLSPLRRRAGHCEAWSVPRAMPVDHLSPDLADRLEIVRQTESKLLAK